MYSPKNLCIPLQKHWNIFFISISYFSSISSSITSCIQPQKFCEETQSFLGNGKLLQVNAKSIKILYHFYEIQPFRLWPCPNAFWFASLGLVLKWMLRVNVKWTSTKCIIFFFGSLTKRTKRTELNTPLLLPNLVNWFQPRVFTVQP